MIGTAHGNVLPYLMLADSSMAQGTVPAALMPRPARIARTTMGRRSQML